VTAAASVRVARTPRWVVVSSIVTSVLGLAIAIYLTVEHYSSSTTFACPESTTVNCVKVTTSSYSRLLGVPVVLPGLAFFLGMLVLCLPQAWAWEGSYAQWLRRARVLVAGLGVVFVVYLIWAELFAIGAICLWCTAVHALTLVLFAVVAIGTASVTVSTFEDD
jgi:uncharacterized membrane protein